MTRITSQIESSKSSNSYLNEDADVVAASYKLPAGIKILVVDDVPDIRFILHFFLKHKGADVLMTDNASDAIKIALMEKPDLILMDMQLPDMDGYIASRRLRHSNFTAPIIGMTAHTINGEREKCLLAGCTDYLSKPIHHGHLLRMIGHHTSQNKFSNH